MPAREPAGSQTPGSARAGGPIPRIETKRRTHVRIDNLRDWRGELQNEVAVGDDPFRTILARLEMRRGHSRMAISNPQSKIQNPKWALPLAAVLLLIPAFACLAPAAPMGGIHLDQIKLPPGFSISVYSDKVRGARSLALSPKGIVYVGTMGSNLYAVADRNHDGVAEEVHTIASGLSTPNGVAWKDGALYVAEV